MRSPFSIMDLPSGINPQGVIDRRQQVLRGDRILLRKRGDLVAAAVDLSAVDAAASQQRRLAWPPMFPALRRVDLGRPPEFAAAMISIGFLIPVWPTGVDGAVRINIISFLVYPLAEPQRMRRDEEMKLMNLPLWQIEALDSQARPAKEPALFADALVPAFQKVRRAHGRLVQRIALLRHVEALRLYAAEHKGTFPAKLSEIPVPLPDDPFTGKPFRYEVSGATAHLRGSPPLGEEKNAAFNLHYEVTLHK
jgi:hypothetical protein